VRRPSRVAALGVAGAAATLASLWALRERLHEWPAPRAMSVPSPAAGPGCALDGPELPGLRIRGGDLRSERLARDALGVLLRTRVGVRAREIVRSGALPEPLTLELNARGDNFTAYRVPGRELGETIAFDPESHPLVDTEQGPLPATPETILAHELGHAIFKLHAEQDVMREIENPIREELGLPRRLRF